MKKKFTMVMILGGLAFIGLGAQAGGKTLYVAVKSTPVKASADLFAGSQGAVNRGTAVTVLRENQKWAQVQTQSQPVLTGWISLAALTSRRPTASGNTASAEELALAGKGLGFSADVEAAYRRDQGLSYGAVDRMEAETIPDRDLYQFLVEGRLSRGDAP